MLNSTKLRIRLLESQVKKHEIPDLLLGLDALPGRFPLHGSSQKLGFNQS